MEFGTEEFNEFKTEATELLDDAETRLLALKPETEFTPHYDAIFRSFHNIKGAAGMTNVVPLQTHLHQVETIFGKFKGKSALPSHAVTFFLRAIDIARKMMESGQAEAFDYQLETEEPKITASTIVPKREAAIVAAPVSKATVSAPAAEAAAAPSVRSRAMVIDDDPSVAEMIGEVLRVHGFEVEVHMSARKGLERIGVFAPHVVVSDLRMPEMSGKELLCEIRKVDIHLPLIYVSGALDKQILLEGLEFGVSGAFEKPFNSKKLIETCLAVARRYQLEKLFNKSVNLVIFQYSDLDEFLLKQGKEEIRRFLKMEVTDLLNRRRELSDHIRQAPKKAG